VFADSKFQFRWKAINEDESFLGELLQDEQDRPGVQLDLAPSFTRWSQMVGEVLLMLNVFEPPMWSSSSVNMNCDGFWFPFHVHPAWFDSVANVFLYESFRLLLLFKLLLWGLVWVLLIVSFWISSFIQRLQTMRMRVCGCGCGCGR
jgi:hypothetical protein